MATDFEKNTDGVPQTPLEEGHGTPIKMRDLNECRFGSDFSAVLFQRTTNNVV